MANGFSSQTSRGERLTTAAIFSQAYELLRSLAQRKMASEPDDHTLSPTALVHEAFLRLRKSGSVSWNNQGHFYSAAAEAMRRILIERARRYQRMKHGGGLARIPLDAVDPALPAVPEELIALDEALTTLERDAPRQAEVVKLRFFAGLSIEETAKVMGVSAGTVKLDWAYARAFLKKQIRSERSGERRVTHAERSIAGETPPGSTGAGSTKSRAAAVRKK